MALTAGEIIALACEAAHSPRKTAQALSFYNSILSDLCQKRDFAEARGQFIFNFTTQGQASGGSVVPVILPPFETPGGGAIDTPGGGAISSPGGVGGQGQGQGQSANWGAAIWGLSSWNGLAGGPIWGVAIWGTAIWGQLPAPPPQPPAPAPFVPHTGNIAYPGNQFGSGPILLPLDYLRLSGSSGSSGAQRSFIWWLDGVPYPVIPMDLAEFDMQVQQIGLQSFVWLSATDMSAPIDDRIILKTTADVEAGSTMIKNLGSTVRLLGGNVLGIAGQGITPGTTLVSLGTATQPGPIESPGGGATDTPGGGAISVPGGDVGPLGTAVISLPANATIKDASIFFGYPPVVYIYPPPISALQAMIRYQKQMPDIVDPTRIPWFRNDDYMLDALIGKLCRLNDDSRADMLLGGPDVTGSAENKLSLYLAMKDDEQSHPKRVELDRRYFGRGIGHLKNTKRVGW